MVEPAIALVFSPESWVEGLHRHCTDHGGAHVRQVVVDPRVALDEEYDTLVVSHRWPALTPALVDALHNRGRRVLGVFDIAEPAGHEHLSRIGVDAAVASDAAMPTFVDAIGELGVASFHDAHHEPIAPAATRRGRLVAVGGTPGAGATEISIALADALGRPGSETVLVDVDEVAPAITPRLALPVEPNLRTAIDGAVHDRRSVQLCTIGGHGFSVLGGLPSTAAWSQVRPEEVLLVLERLAGSQDTIVANIGSHLELVGEAGRDRFGVSRAVVGIADAIVGVTTPTPVGVVRAVAWAGDVRVLARESSLHLVVNRAPRDGFRRNELLEELARSIDAESFGCIADDRRVGDAAWAGQLVAKGGFTRAIAELARCLSGGSRRPSRAILG